MFSWECPEYKRYYLLMINNIVEASPRVPPISRLLSVVSKFSPSLDSLIWTPHSVMLPNVFRICRCLDTRPRTLQLMQIKQITETDVFPNCSVSIITRVLGRHCSQPSQFNVKAQIL